MQVQVLEKLPSTQVTSSEVFYSIFDPVDPNPDKSSLFTLVPKKFDVSSLGPVLLSTKLQKKAKKVGITISRHFFLFSNHLAYSSSDNPSKIKKYTELKGLKVNIGTTEGKTADEKTKYTITLFRSKMQLKLYTHQQDIADKWWEQLKKFCIMTNFDDFYKRKDILGKGAHGKVVLAVNNRTERNYAVKIFEKIQLITQLKGFESIINEIDILRKIEHRGIIRLHEVYESVSCVYLVLDYMEGGELYTRLKQRKMFSEHQCIDLMKNMLEALNFMHSRNIVHKDIKPENICLVSENSEIDLKLVDFGFATDLTVSNELKRCGTPGYVSPEVLNPNKGTILTTKADIFALGAIFYQLLTGSKLFSGGTVEEILKKNKQCYINTTKLEAKRISASAKDLLFKMLEKDPDQRISAAEILEHPFLTNTQVSTTEIPDDSDDSPVGQVTRYSFDMSYLKEQNICSHSKVCDSAGTFYITSHIPLDPQKQTWSRLHFDYERGPLPLHHLDASPKSIYSPGTSNATSESSFDEEESKCEERVQGSPKNTLSISANMQKTKKSWGSGTPTASPFHKAAILNNIKKTHLMELKPLEENGEEAPSGSFTDFLNKFSQKKHSYRDHSFHPGQSPHSLTKRNSVI